MPKTYTLAPHHPADRDKHSILPLYDLKYTAPSADTLVGVAWYQITDSNGGVAFLDVLIECEYLGLGDNRWVCRSSETDLWDEHEGFLDQNTEDDIRFWLRSQDLIPKMSVKDLSRARRAEIRERLDTYVERVNFYEGLLEK